MVTTFKTSKYLRFDTVKDTGIRTVQENLQKIRKY
jgi:hypothetical protein